MHELRNQNVSEFMVDRRSYTHNLKVVVKLKPEKNSGLNGIRTHESVIPVQCSLCGIAEVMGSNPVQAWYFVVLDNTLKVLTRNVFL